MADNNISIDRWKFATIGLLAIGVTALVTTLVVGQRTSTEPVKDQEAKAAAVQKTQSKPAPAKPAQPSLAVVESCNKYADDQVTGKTTEVLRDAGIGAVIGAAVGAAGGAIADGGKGAGKGAAIGGVVGVAGGSLYGLNENKTHNEKYKIAYSSCMRSKGFPV
jgi:hypothetical protein